ncbi:hypothetical protein STEG23_024837 [Scotinomys teguina]
MRKRRCSGYRLYRPSESPHQSEEQVQTSLCKFQDNMKFDVGKLNPDDYRYKPNEPSCLEALYEQIPNISLDMFTINNLSPFTGMEKHMDTSEVDLI